MLLQAAPLVEAFDQLNHVRQIRRRMRLAVPGQPHHQPEISICVFAGPYKLFEEAPTNLNCSNGNLYYDVLLSMWISAMIARELLHGE